MNAMQDDSALSSPTQLSPSPAAKGREQEHPAHAPKPQTWFDGTLIDSDAQQAGLTTHAMHYGSGVFEGIRAYATADGGAGRKFQPRAGDIRAMRRMPRALS